jgi:hypothetical protein
MHIEDIAMEGVLYIHSDGMREYFSFGKNEV